MAELTPMMKQYMETKEQYKDCILFYRLGDFYEMFFDDALAASKELEITLTGKNCGLEERAPMCGIPYHAVDGYLTKLVSSLCIVVFCKDPVKIGEGTFVLCLTCAAQCHISAGEDHKIIQLSLRLIGVWSAVKQIPHVFCIGIGARSAIACNIKSLKVVFRGCVISK